MLIKCDDRVTPTTDFTLLRKLYLSVKVVVAVVRQCSQNNLLKCAPEVQGDS